MPSTTVSMPIRILEYMRDGNLYTSRDITDAFGGGDVSRVSAALSRLTDGGYIHKADQTRATGSGGTPANVYYLSDLGRARLTDELGIRFDHKPTAAAAPAEVGDTDHAEEHGVTLPVGELAERMADVRYPHGGIAFPAEAAEIEMVTVRVHITRPGHSASHSVMVPDRGPEATAHAVDTAATEALRDTYPTR